ncbi:L,D-transpeptidase [Frigoribacterium sp. CG_9.8]|uniref:L,D-transpeptidase n=1 Tax=Frigoribacterium sp. CG_9.8 TaxID=2787733 RepID=UPI0018CB8546|nr:L,D-transpeptidase [Frigoribacterium sp. CG_9.8]
MRACLHAVDRYRTCGAYRSHIRRGHPQTVYPIQLASLHSSAADEPYGGNDGGLIGVHYNPVATGDVSHGCVRLSKEAITAVNRLPLGTLINIVP